MTIDDKNRLLVPAEIRRLIKPDEHGDAFFLVPGVNRLPWFYPERYYEDLVMQVQSDLKPGEDRLAFDQRHFSMASKLPLDKTGRVLLPEKILKRSGIDKSVTLIGARDHLELWNREAWDARREELWNDAFAGATKGAGSAPESPTGTPVGG